MMRKGLKPLFVCTLLILAPACASHSKSPADIQGPINHIVVCWLKSPGDAEQARRVIETSRSFAEIPGVRSVRVGQRLRLPTTRPIDETTFDIAMVMTFNSPQALREYQDHPEHQAAVRDVLRPMTRRILIYDFSAE